MTRREELINHLNLLLELEGKGYDCREKVEETLVELHRNMRITSILKIDKRDSIVINNSTERTIKKEDGKWVSEILKNPSLSD